MKKKFEEAGFTNIKTEALADLSKDDMKNDDKVKSIQISGDSNFVNTNTYFSDSELILSPIQQKMKNIRK